MSKRIKGITIEINAETKGLDKALQDVNKSSRDINKELRDVNKLLKFNPKDTELLAQKQKLLGDQVATTREKLDRLKEAEAEVQAQFERGDIGEEQYRAFQREVVETESKLKHYENQLKQVSDSHLILSQNLQDAGKKMQDVGKKVSDVGGNLTKKLTLPIVGVGAAASKLGIDFEASMSEVGAVTGATSEELETLEKAAREAGATTNKSARDAADALKYMGLAGWDVTESQKALMPMLKLSTAGNMELGRTSDLVTDSMSALGLGIDDLDGYLDILAQTSRNSNTDIDALGEAFVQVGGRLKLLEVETGEAAVALGILGDNGIKGSEAGRGLNAILTNLTAPTGRAKEALEELGVSAFDSAGEFIGIEETLKLVEGSMEGMTQEQQNMYLSMIAGKEHGKTFNALLGSLGDGWDSLAGDVGNAEGALDEMYDTMTNNTAGAVDNLKSALEELGLKIWDNLKPSIDWLVDKIQGLTDKLNSLSPETQQMIVKMGLIAAAIGPVLLIMGKLITVVGTITAAIGKLIPIVIAVAGALNLPVVALVAIGAAVAALVAVIVTHWDEIKSKTVELWNSLVESFIGIKDSFVETWNSIGEFFSELWASIVDMVTSAWDTITNVIQVAIMFIGEILSLAIDIITLPFQFIWENCKEIIIAAWEAIKLVVSTGIEAVKNVISNVMNVISSVFSTIWNAIKNTITTVLNAISSVVTSVWNNIKSTISSVMNAISSVISSIWNNIKGTVSSVLNAISSTVSSVWNNIKGTVSSVMNSISSVVSNIWNNISSTISGIVNSIQGTISNGFNAALNTTSNIFDNIKNKIQSIMDGAADVVRSAIDRIKSFFNFSWSLPHLRLPHISVSGRFSLNPPSAPSFGISWYKDGAIFQNPTLFNTPFGVKGVGEAGAEAVLPISKLSGILADTLDKAGYGKANQSDSKMDRQVVQHITIESPTPLTPSEVARQTKNATRALAMEW